MSLHISYNDGSNPFVVLNASKQKIAEHIKWQRKHNGSYIREMFVVHDDMKIEHMENLYIPDNYMRGVDYLNDC